MKSITREHHKGTSITREHHKGTSQGKEITREHHKGTSQRRKEQRGGERRERVKMFPLVKGLKSELRNQKSKLRTAKVRREEIQ